METHKKLMSQSWEKPATDRRTTSDDTFEEIRESKSEKKVRVVFEQILRLPDGRAEQSEIFLKKKHYRVTAAQFVGRWVREGSCDRV